MLVAVAFHCSINVAASAACSSVASRAARPAVIVGMNALQLHHETSATMASDRAVSVARRYAGANRSAIVGGFTVVATRDQRSGSLTNHRTTNATAAGARPTRNT